MCLCNSDDAVGSTLLQFDSMVNRVTFAFSVCLACVEERYTCLAKLRSVNLPFDGRHTHTRRREERRVSTHSLLHVNLQHRTRERGSCNSLSLSLFFLSLAGLSLGPSRAILSSLFFPASGLPLFISLPLAFSPLLSLFSSVQLMQLSLSTNYLPFVCNHSNCSLSFSATLFFIVYHMCDDESIVVTSKPSSPEQGSFECTCKSHMNHCSLKRFNSNVPVNLSPVSCECDLAHFLHDHRLHLFHFTIGESIFERGERERVKRKKKDHLLSRALLLVVIVVVYFSICPIKWEKHMFIDTFCSIVTCNTHKRTEHINVNECCITCTI